MQHNNFYLPHRLLNLLGFMLMGQGVFCQDIAHSAITSDTTSIRLNPSGTPDSTKSFLSTHRTEAAPANDNFANATNIAVTTCAGYTTGTTNGATLETNENTDCTYYGYSPQASVWYKFTATASNLYVSLKVVTGTFYLGAAVWNSSVLPTGNCPSIQCQDALADKSYPNGFSMELTNLSTGGVYYIQVVDDSSNDANTFDLTVSTASCYTVYNPPPANNCSTAVPGCYINSFAPSMATVEASCPGYQFQKPPYPANNPYPKGGLQNGYVYTLCYYFTNLNTSGQINIQNLLYTCAYNTYWLDWTVYDATCNLLACGNLANLTVSGVACNTQYTICETFEAACDFDNNVPANNGSNLGIVPYASWPSASPLTCAVLPIKLLTFNVDYEQPSNTVYLNWSTASETNNKLFTLLKSANGKDWATFATLPGAGNSSKTLYYSATDESPYQGVSYYRLEQTDNDGEVSYSQIMPVTIPADYSVHIFPNPTGGDITLSYSTLSPDPVKVVITDLSGKVISSYSIDNVLPGQNKFNVPTSPLEKGMYFMQVSNAQKTFYLKFVKQ